MSERDAPRAPATSHQPWVHLPELGLAQVYPVQPLHLTSYILHLTLTEGAVRARLGQRRAADKAREQARFEGVARADGVDGRHL